MIAISVCAKQSKHITAEQQKKTEEGINVGILEKEYYVSLLFLKLITW